MATDTRNFESEFEYITSRSSGPGGQNVNKTETRVELRFNVFESAILSDYEKEKINNKIGNKISKEGILSVVSQDSRSQLDNKLECIRKFYVLLEFGLKVEKKRRLTKTPWAIQLQRLNNKKNNSEKKQNRKKDFLD